MTRVSTDVYNLEKLLTSTLLGSLVRCSRLCFWGVHGRPPLQRRRALLVAEADRSTALLLLFPPSLVFAPVFFIFLSQCRWRAAG